MLRHVFVILIALGCSKKSDKAPPPPPPPPAADAAVTVDAAVAVADAAAAGSGSGSDVAFDFDKLTTEEKKTFMKNKVMPAMKTAFSTYDPKKYANVTCKTCHGKDPQKNKFKMPNPELPALDFDEIKAGKKDPKMVEFMAKKVKPEMAKLLQQPEMTETVHEGFGCLDCHTMKKKKGDKGGEKPEKPAAGNGAKK